MEIKDKALSIEKEIINYRRYFHQNPELSKKEFETSKKIQNILTDLGYCCTKVGNSVIGELSNGCSTKAVALRADIDALPIEEKTELPFASSNFGVMHACGHDCHIAMLLGAAKILSDSKELINGKVKLIFQEAEEHLYGAKTIVKTDYLKDTHAIFGIHVMPEIFTGGISLELGPRMASASQFTIKVKGVSGHGSMPHKAIDAILVLSTIVVNLQSIVSRSINPFDMLVISVGKFSAGHTNNIIAGDAELEGTIRYTDPTYAQMAPLMIKRIAEGTASTFGATAEIEFEEITGPVINDQEYTELAALSAQKVGLKLDHVPTYSGSEDFSYYSQLCKTVFGFLGIRGKDSKYVSIHNDKFDIDEAALCLGSAAYAQFAIDALKHSNT